MPTKLPTYIHGYGPHMAGYGLHDDDCCERHKGTGEFVRLSDVIELINPILDDMSAGYELARGYVYDIEQILGIENLDCSCGDVRFARQHPMHQDYVDGPK